MTFYSVSSKINKKKRSPHMEISIEQDNCNNRQVYEQTLLEKMSSADNYAQLCLPLY